MSYDTSMFEDRKMSNHQKTTLIEKSGLGGELSLIEKILLGIGLGWVVSIAERVRVFNRVNRTPGMSAKPSSEVDSNEKRFKNVDF